VNVLPSRASVLPTTEYSQAEDALTLARALVNDSAGAVFTDSLLMPLLNSGYRGLQRELAETIAVKNSGVLDENHDAYTLGTGDAEYHRRVRADGKVQERWEHVEPAAEHLSAVVGMA
jgi:hypothetical protein